MRFDYKSSYLKINNLSNSKIIGALKNIEKDILVYIVIFMVPLLRRAFDMHRRGAAMNQIHLLFSAIPQKQSRVQIEDQTFLPVIQQRGP